MGEKWTPSQGPGGTSEGPAHPPRDHPREFPKTREGVRRPIKRWWPKTSRTDERCERKYLGKMMNPKWYEHRVHTKIHYHQTIEDEERKLKAVGEKQLVTYKSSSIRF